MRRLLTTLALALAGTAPALSGPLYDVPLLINDRNGVVMETTIASADPDILFCSMTYSDYWSSDPTSATCLVRTSDVIEVKGVTYTRVELVELPVTMRSAT